MAFGALIFGSIFGEVGELVARSGIFAKVIILILFVLSVVSWAVMADRSRSLSRARKANAEFWRRLDAVRQGEGDGGDLEQWSERNRHSPLASVFLYFRREFWPLYERRRDGEATLGTLQGFLARGVERESTQAVERLDRNLGWLATLGAIAPFLGLLGTVWGIMGSFMQLGRQGAATLDVVGPGIAEALITTVCGLAVAIPAVVAYNYFMRRLQEQENDLDRLSTVLADVVAEEELDRRPRHAVV